MGQQRTGGTRAGNVDYAADTGCPLKTPNCLRLTFALQALVRQLLDNDIELVRPCRTGCLLLLSGLTANSLPSELTNRVYAEQHTDGGWVGPDDTMWSLLFLKLLGHRDADAFVKGVSFLHARRANQFGWGRSERDIPRIPITGRILHFLPEVHRPEYTDGLMKLWTKEKDSLTYKASFTLAAMRTAGSQPAQNSAIRQAIEWLTRQQNTDGGFSPWKGHPVGSDIYCTAISILGLLQYSAEVPHEVIEKAVEWMSVRQLGNGLWAYHQIEDGAAWGLYASYLVQTTLESRFYCSTIDGKQNVRVTS